MARTRYGTGGIYSNGARATYDLWLEDDKVTVGRYAPTPIDEEGQAPQYDKSIIIIPVKELRMVVDWIQKIIDNNQEKLPPYVTTFDEDYYYQDLGDM